MIADVLSAATAGLAHSDVHELRTAALGGMIEDGHHSGPSSVIGRSAGAPPALAAYLNATSIAREQLQDGHRRARGHPGSHVVPAVFAVAESVGADGPSTLSAVLAGYEIGTRIGVAMDGTPPNVHDIGTWASVGAAAGVAHLLTGGDRTAVAAAVDVAAALPLAPDARTVFTGRTAQNMYLATAALHAVLGGQAAAAGVRAAPGTLELHFARITAADPAGFARRLDALAADGEWTVLDGYLKRHPTCALLHGVNDAVEDLARRGPWDPALIESVRVRTYAAAASFDESAPTGELAARFSIPWTVAAGLTATGSTGDAFGRAALDDQALRALAARVVVEHDRDLDAGYPDGRPAVVTVRFTDGRSLTETASGPPRGDGPDALADPVVAAKPARLLAVGGSTWAGDVLDAVAALTSTGRPADIGSLLRRVRPIPDRER
ncbi:MmgE/PrpD family protein [Gordonia humi]